MNIKAALKNLNRKYKVANGIHCLTHDGNFFIEIEEYEAIVKHIDEIEEFLHLISCAEGNDRLSDRADRAEELIK